MDRNLTDVLLLVHCLQPTEIDHQRLQCQMILAELLGIWN